MEKMFLVVFYQGFLLVHLCQLSFSVVMFACGVGVTLQEQLYVVRALT